MINRKAFTLIEVLVIISLLIILIGMTIPRVKGMQDAGNIAHAKGELQTLQTAVESYYVYPIAGQAKAYPPTTVGLVGSFLTGRSPQIISIPPYDPWGAGGATEYNYVLSANAKYYIIASMGVDGAFTTTLGVGSGGVVTKDPDDYCVTNGSGC